MKVLSLRAHFKLPDNFDGSFGDALRELADYHDSTGRKKEGRTTGHEMESKETETWNEAADALWKSFMEAIDEGFRLHGEVYLGSFVDGEWQSLDKNYDREPKCGQS